MKQLPKKWVVYNFGCLWKWYLFSKWKKYKNQQRKNHHHHKSLSWNWNESNFLLILKYCVKVSLFCQIWTFLYTWFCRQNHLKMEEQQNTRIPWIQKVRQSLSLISLEPIVFLQTFTWGLASVIGQNLIIDKVCR